MVRLTALSPEARAALDGAGNRSEYVRRAIEHFAAGGQAVAAVLERIEARLGAIEARLAHLEARGAAPLPAATGTAAGAEAAEEAIARALNMAAAWVEDE